MAGPNSCSAAGEPGEHAQREGAVRGDGLPAAHLTGPFAQVAGAQHEQRQVRRASGRGFPGEVGVARFLQAVRVFRMAGQQVQARRQVPDAVDEDRQRHLGRPGQRVEKRAGAPGQRASQDGEERLAVEAGFDVHGHGTAAAADQGVGPELPWSARQDDRRGERGPVELTGTAGGRGGHLRDHRPVLMALGSGGWVLPASPRPRAARRGPR